jgi:hypothetical protein
MGLRDKIVINSAMVSSALLAAYGALKIGGIDTSKIIAGLSGDEEATLYLTDDQIGRVQQALSGDIRFLPEREAEYAVSGADDPLSGDGDANDPMG